MRGFFGGGFCLGLKAEQLCDCKGGIKFYEVEEGKLQVKTSDLFLEERFG